MVLKRITVYFPMAPEAAAALKAAHPTIVLSYNREGRKWIFDVDITATQETQVRSEILDAIIKIETV